LLRLCEGKGRYWAGIEGTHPDRYRMLRGTPTLTRGAVRVECRSALSLIDEHPFHPLMG